VNNKVHFFGGTETVDAADYSLLTGGELRNERSLPPLFLCDLMACIGTSLQIFKYYDVRNSANRHCVICYVSANVSEEHVASIFRELYLENEGLSLLGMHLPICTASHLRNPKERDSFLRTSQFVETED
jgi:hypothetical protein